MKRIIITAIIVAIGFAGSSFAAIINIPADYPTIQTGIDASSNGDTVLVQPGMYVENVNFNGHNIVLGSLFLTTGDTSYIAETIIDGDSSGTVVTFDSGEDSTATIIGLTIRNGIAFSYPNLYRGGGITCLNNSNPSILNNLISENFSFEDYGSAAISCGGSSPFIFNNIITGNTGIYKSGVSCWDYSNAVIIDNNIHGNNTINTGEGAVSCNGHSEAIITGNTIIGNSGRGISIINESSPVIENNTISGNSFNGIRIGMNSSPIINGNFISENGNSGIYCNNSNPIISSNFIWGNFPGSSSDGDGIFFRNSMPIVNNNIIFENNGDGIHFQDSSSFVTNNTIFGNNDYGIYCSGSELTVINSILWGNNGGTDNQIFIQSGTATVEYCDIQGGWAGRGNINFDPLFRNPTDGDYHLMSTSCGDLLDSPCIDAGYQGIIDTLLDCSWGLGTIRSDIGAYGGGDTIFVNTNVLNVPGDYPTIQMAIDASYEGDTVLVQPDSYFENINFDGHNVVVGSMFMMTGDISFISSTIIDGSAESSVISINSGENRDARVIGFTIQNGSANHGGGIYCQESDPVISNNIIRNNEAISFGAGILCLESSSIIKNNLFTGNNANQGAAICCMESNPAIINNTMTGNTAYLSGGGIYCSLVSNPVIINTIMWGDSAAYEPEIDFDDSSSPSFSFCNIQGGWSGNGNIDIDPLFRDPDLADFHLKSDSCGDIYNSPCIDAGDPSIEDIRFGCDWGLEDIRSDMGAYGGGEWTMVDIDDNIVDPPVRFSLLQNYPNPFNPTTVIRYSLPARSDVRIEIYNILGQKVSMLFDGNKQAGYHTITWQADHYPSGVYFVRLDTGARSENIKMVLLK